MTAVELGEVWLVAQAALEAHIREARWSHDLGRDEVVAQANRGRRAARSERIARESAIAAARRELPRYLARAVAREAVAS